MVTQEIKDTVLSNLKSKFEEAKKSFNKLDLSIETMELPTVSYDLKGHKAGYATLQKNHITLNSQIITNPKYTTEMSEDTLYHELAHLIVFHLYGSGKFSYKKIKSHGDEWKHVMTVLGQEANRTHSYETKSARKTDFIDYVCECRGEDAIHPMSKLKHNRILKGGKYTCMNCKSILTIKDNATLYSN